MLNTTNGQRFARRMRGNLGIGPRTRRHRAGRNMHKDILECIANNAWIPGYYSDDRSELFGFAYGSWLAYDKHISGRRVDGNLIALIDAMSPWKFCALLGQMIDANVTNVGQGEQFFNDMARAGS